MKYCKFLSANGTPRYANVEDRNGTLWAASLMEPPVEDLATQLAILDSPEPFEAAPLSSLKLLAPVTPSKILCIGRNYKEHAAELGNEVPKEPLLFFKPPSSLLAPGGTILRPKVSERTDFEGELGVVIAKRAYKLPDDADTRPYILGYTCVNDFTARDLQNKDAQWTRAKGFDTFCPVGPVVADGLDPWAGVEVETKLNGTIRQQGNTKDFIFSLGVVI